MGLEQLIRQHLQTGRMMQLATVKDDQPWCCTLFYVYDEDLNLYWISLPDRRHSQEIHVHSKVAAAIPIEHKPGQPIAGLQVEGDAMRIDDPEIIKSAMRLYTDRYQTGEQWYKDFLAGKNPHVLYRLKPRLFVVFDEITFPNNSRQEWRP